MFEFQIGQGQESDIICLSYLHKGGKLENQKMMEASWNYCMQQDFLKNKCQLQFRIRKTNFQLLQTVTNIVKLKEICSIVGE
jgi:hypothetical protein